MQPATFMKFYVHHTFVKCETVTDLKRDLACRLNSPYSCAPGYMYKHLEMNSI